MFAATEKKLLRSAGARSGAGRGSVEKLDGIPPGETARYIEGVRAYEVSSETVFASDAGSAAAIESNAAKRWSAAAGFLSRNADRNWIDPIVARTSAGSANCKARSTLSDAKKRLASLNLSAISAPDISARLLFGSLVRAASSFAVNFARNSSPSAGSRRAA